MAVDSVIEICTQFAYTHKVHPGGPVYSKSAGDDFLNVCGRVNLDFSINHLSMNHEFVVVENLTFNVLIGGDFMYKFNIVIDYVKRTTSFLGNLVVAKLITSQVSYVKQLELLTM